MARALVYRLRCFYLHPFDAMCYLDLVFGIKARFFFILIILYTAMGRASSDCEHTFRKAEIMQSFKNVLIITAMDVEHDALAKRDSKEVVLSERLGIKASTMQIGNTQLNIIKSGVGAVNAGTAVAFAIDKLSIDAVIMVGVGGALDSKLDIGDLVVASKVVQHDAVISRSAQEGGWALMSPGELFLTKTDSAFAEPEIQTTREIHDAMYSAFEAKGDRVFSGMLLSGSEFVGNSERKAELARRHPGALLVDMEACAVAQLCRKYGIAFAIAKTVADRLNPDGSISSDYKVFLKAAAQRAAAIVSLLFGEA